MQNSLKKCLSKEDNEISNSKDKTNRYVRNRSKSCSDKDRVSWEGKDLTAMKEIKSEASTPTIVEQKGSMRLVSRKKLINYFIKSNSKIYGCSEKLD